MPDVGACAGTVWMEAVSAISAPARQMIAFIVISPSVSSLFVIVRRELERCALRSVVIDPEPGVVLFEKISDALIRGQRFLAVDVVRRHVSLLPALLDVHRVTGQKHGAKIRQFDQKTLMA